MKASPSQEPSVGRDRLHRRLARWAPLRLIIVRPRYFLALALSFLLFIALAGLKAYSTRLLLAWDGGMLFFLISMAWLMYRTPAQNVPKMAARQDLGHHFILLLSVGSALLSFFTIAVEIRLIRHAEGLEQALRVGLIFSTIMLSWCFVQFIFAQHYAHRYFVRFQGKGLDFPGPDIPLDYGDFLYFSFTIGSAFATSDVSVTTPEMRRIVTAHTVLSFLFNTLILGLSVNVGAGLL